MRFTLVLVLVAAAVWLWLCGLSVELRLKSRVMRRVDQRVSQALQ